MNCNFITEAPESEKVTIISPNKVQPLMENYGERKEYIADKLYSFAAVVIVCAILVDIITFL